MSKKTTKVPAAYIRSEKRRQRYLDFLNANPGALAVDIERHMISTFGETAKTTNTTRMLCTLGEAYMVKSTNTNGYRYFAIATETTSANAMIQRHIEANDKYNSSVRVGSGHKEKPKASSDEPWRYVHNPGHYNVEGHLNGHPLKDQQAIGSGRRRVYVGCAGDIV